MRQPRERRLLAGNESSARSKVGANLTVLGSSSQVYYILAALKLI